MEQRQRKIRGGAVKSGEPSDEGNTATTIISTSASVTITNHYHYRHLHHCHYTTTKVY
jgi:hypothetical protein